MRDRSNREQHDDNEGYGIERRELLNLLGMGGVLLAASRVQALKDAPAAAGAAATPTNTPVDCGPKQACADVTAPPVTPEVANLPPLAQLISVLIGIDEDPRTNRRNFNNCPDKFVDTFFKLSADEIKAFLAFDPGKAFVYLGTQIPAPGVDPAKFYEYLKLNGQTYKFWWSDWENEPIKDCYDDPPWCPPEVPKQYAKPETIIHTAVAATSADVTTLTVTCQGVVGDFTLEAVDSNGVAVPFVATLNKDSTFRCCTVVGTKTPALPAGTYNARLTISGYIPTPKQFTAP